MSPYKKGMNILVLYKNHRSDRYVFAKLRGRNEVPPVETDARGEAFFKLSRDELSLKIQVRFIRYRGCSSCPSAYWSKRN